jgi:acyl carrier protein
MDNLSQIKSKVKEIILQIVEVEGVKVELSNTTPFFGTEQEEGVIQDSLAILEISSKLADEYGFLPSDFSEEAFYNVDSLSEFILARVEENELAAV